MKKIKQSYALASILGALAIGGMAVLSSANVISLDGSAENGDVLPATTTRERVATSTRGLVTAPVTVGTSNADCMKAALGVREESLRKAFDAKNQGAVSALNARGEAQKNAWSTDIASADRKNTLKATWTTYKQTVDKLAKDWRAARKAAWAQYAKNRKYCGTAAVADDGSPSESLDSQL